MAQKKLRRRKPDTSERVHQGPKVKEIFEVRPFNWTEKQQNFIEAALDKNTKVILCNSVPGVGKTLVSLFCSLELMRQKKISKIYYIRNPIESSSHGLGYIKGEIQDKFLPYLMPLVDHLNELLTPSVKNELINNGFIEGMPVGYLKGRTFHGSALIVDEAEDLTIQELLLTMSRRGKFSKLFIIGDSNQSNIKKSGFESVFSAFDNYQSECKGIKTIKFNESDIVRDDGLLPYIIEVFATLKN